MASCSNNPIPPDVKKIPKKLKAHGHIRTDNYYWMRLTDEQKTAKKYDAQTQDVISYIDDETEYLNESLFLNLKFFINTTYSSQNLCFIIGDWSLVGLI